MGKQLFGGHFLNFVNKDSNENILSHLKDRIVGLMGQLYNFTSKT